MNHHTDLDQALREYSHSIQFAGRQRVLTRLSQAGRSGQTTSAKIGRRAALVFAVVMALVAATVFADDLANILREFTFSSFTATQQDVLIAESDGSILSSQIAFIADESVEKVSLKDAEAIRQWEFFNVEDIDEVKRQLDFMRVPQSLPEGYVFDCATLIRYPSGKLDQSVTLHYAKEGAHGYDITIQEHHVGENGTIDLKTVDTIEQTKIGDADALVKYNEYYSIIWVQDATAYQVSAWDAKTARMVAESIP